MEINRDTEFIKKTIREIKKAQRDIDSPYVAVFLLTRIRTLAFELGNSQEKKLNKEKYPNIDLISNWAIHGKLDQFLKKRFETILDNLGNGKYSFMPFFEELSQLYKKHSIDPMNDEGKLNLVGQLKSTLFEICFDNMKFILIDGNKSEYELKAVAKVETLDLEIVIPEVSASWK